MSTDLKSQIELINKQLKDGEPANIQEDSHRTNYTVYGYYPYDVFKAVNNTLGPEGWRVVVLSHDHDDRFAWCTVRVTIGEVVREQAGHSQVVKGAIGDALKGSVTDATQKALSMFGIAHRAYRGLLKDAYGKPVTKKTEPNPNKTQVGEDAVIKIRALQKELYDVLGDEEGKKVYKAIKYNHSAIGGGPLYSIEDASVATAREIYNTIKKKIGETK